MIKVLPGSIEDFYSIYNCVWPDQAEDAEVATHEAEALEPEQRARHWIAFLDQIPVGALEVGHDIGSFHPNRWQIDLSVLPDYRRRGIATALADEAFRFLIGRPIDLLTVRTKDDPASFAFAAKHGFTEEKRDFWSVLDLKSVDLALVHSMHERLPEGILLAKFEEVDNLMNRIAMHELFEEVRVDIPRVSPPTPLSFDQFNKLVLSDPHLDATCTTFALREGRFVGNSGAFASAQPGVVDQGLTAVKREERGRGLAQAMKAEVILKARERGYQQIRTDNDSRNLSILSINDRLGFKRLPATITMTRNY